MNAELHYPNAPITEAIIDLAVEFPTEFSPARLKQISDTEKAEYPDLKEVVETVGKMSVGPRNGAASVESLSMGWKSTSTDGKQVFQSLRNRFTFSRLAPYDNWEPFRDEAQRLWNVYRDQAAPETILRLAVRYINRIDIPGSRVDLKQYFRTSPEIAPELPQQLEGYFMQLQLPLPNVEGNCLLNHTIVPPVRPGVVSVVLDIDLFRASDVPQDERTIWNFFETLHVEKNRVFEACITDLTRSLFH